VPEPNPALLDAVRRGSVEAVETLIREQQAYIYSVALGVVRDPDDAADVMQESCVRLVRTLPSYRGESRFTTWLYRLVVNLGLDFLRRRGRIVSLGDEQAAAERLPAGDAATDPQRALDRRETAATVRGALARLPAPQRLALTLLYFDDLQYDEIAEIMGVPLNTVKSHIRRGKERLALELRDQAPPDAAERG
jgi:RNA polymerase sigma-70 factor (ECF subfamily)